MRAPAFLTLVALVATLAAVRPPAVVAQPPPAAKGQPAKPPLAPGVERLRQKLNPEFPTWSNDYVLERCAEHLAQVVGRLRTHYAKKVGVTAAAPPTAEQLAAIQKYIDDDTYNLKFISLASAPRARLPEQIAALFFSVNSASPAPAVYRPVAVPGTDNRIFTVDVRYLYWKAQAVEAVSLEDPYFREPAVSSDSPALKFLKETTRSNPVFRGDWFTYYLGDTSQFLKADPAAADGEKAFYYRLLYSTNKTVVKKTVTADEPATETRQVFQPGYGYVTQQVATTKKVTKTVEEAVYGRVPATEDEFLDFWGVDEDLAREKQADNFGVVDEGSSGVSYSNRVVRRITGGGGVLWETYDTLRTAGDADYLEALPIPPKDFVAGELIFRNPKGAQFYLLTNGRGERVEFADPRVVHDTVSGGKTVLVTWKSCAHCHDVGILPIKNEVPLAIASGADLKAKSPEEAQQIRAAYLKNLQRRVKFDQDEYEEFVLDCNGLTGPENAAQYKAARDWYAAPLTVEQAAREVGAASVQEFTDALSVGTKVRLGRLLTDGKPVPRSVWEYGGYAEAALLLIEYRKAVDADRAKRGLPPVTDRGIMGK